MLIMVHTGSHGSRAGCCGYSVAERMCQQGSLAVLKKSSLGHQLATHTGEGTYVHITEIKIVVCHRSFSDPLSYMTEESPI